MGDVKWIKIVTDIFDDEKILLIESLPSADSLIVIWFKLLCLAGKNNNNGVFLLNDKIAYTDEMLATIFRRDVNTIRLALNTFEEFGMIEIVEGVITIPNWGKHQNLDKLEQKNEYMKNYMRDYRKKQKEKIECKTNGKTNSKTNSSSNSKANVSEAEIDIDKEKEEEKNIYIDQPKKERKKKIFVPPTEEEVDAYCKERGNGISGAEFVASYESKGWVVGRNQTPMKDWKAAVRTWEQNRGFKYIPPVKETPNLPSQYADYE